MFGVHVRTQEGQGRVHPAIRDVAVVRDGETVDTDIAQHLLVGPEILRIDGIKGRERHFRRLVLEEHVSQFLAH